MKSAQTLLKDRKIKI